MKVIFALGLLLVILQRWALDYLRSETKVGAKPVIIHHEVRVASKYANLTRAFEANFLQARERGAQLVCIVDGQIVADMSGGRDAENVFTSQTMIFSAGKVVESLAVAILVERYGLEYTDPIAKHWPRFGQAFEGNITIAQLMKHRARLGKIQIPFAREEDARQVFADADKLEEWVFHSLSVDQSLNPNESSAYHAITRGIIVDLLIFKVDGRRGSKFIQQEITDKLGIPAEECSVGQEEEDRAPVAECESTAPLWVNALKTIFHPLLHLLFHAELGDTEFAYWFLTMPEFIGNLQLASSAEARKYFKLAEGAVLQPHELANSKLVQQLPLLSSGMICNARSMAKINAALMGGEGNVSLLSRAAFKKALENDGPMYDELMKRNVTFTNAGWGADRFGPDWIGWAGAGGSMNLFNVKRRATLAYVPTMLETRWHKPNAVRILNALREILKE